MNTNLSNRKLIELSDGSMYAARLHPVTGSEDPLTLQEIVILDLHRQIEASKVTLFSKESMDEAIKLLGKPLQHECKFHVNADWTSYQPCPCGKTIHEK
jgi:hypothetical protein